jgi:hypothetical protein
VLEGLRAGLDLAMALAGAPSLASVTRDLIVGGQADRSGVTAAGGPTASA